MIGLHNGTSMRVFIAKRWTSLMVEYGRMSSGIMIIGMILVIISMLVVIVRRRRMWCIIVHWTIALVLIVVTLVFGWTEGQLPQLRSPPGFPHRFQHLLPISPSGDRHLLHAHVYVYVIHPCQLQEEQILNPSYYSIIHFFFKIKK